jgi:phosphate uptake regulator
MIMETRRIQLVGNRSYSVSLPKEWVKGNNLKEKDVVFIENNNSDTLTLSSSKKEKNPKAIIVNTKNIDDIKGFVVFCYIKNIDYLVLKLNEFDYETIKNIRKVISHLEGYDITYEDNKTIEIKFLFKETSINLNQLFKKQIYLLKILINSIKSKDFDYCKEIELSIDKTFYLSNRIIFSCLNNNNIKRENNIFKTDDLIFYSQISKKLENIGDIIYKIKAFADINEKIFELLSNYMNSIEKLFLINRTINIKSELKDLFKNNEIDEEYKSIINKIHHLCWDLAEYKSLINFNEIIDNLIDKVIDKI